MPNPEFVTPNEAQANKPELPIGIPKRRAVPEMPKIVPDKTPIPTAPTPSIPIEPIRTPLEPVPVR